VEQKETVSNLINCLTDNEDERQELWLHYLNGNAPCTFASHLDKINRVFTADTEIQEQLWNVLNNPPSEKFQQMLSCFSEIEQSIVCLLALGLTTDQISGYKGITEIRIKQVISVVRENNCWEEIYGIEDTTNRR
jgi:hypothetical protein